MSAKNRQNIVHPIRRSLLYPLNTFWHRQTTKVIQMAHQHAYCTSGPKTFTMDCKKD